MRLPVDLSRLKALSLGCAALALGSCVGGAERGAAPAPAVVAPPAAMVDDPPARTGAPYQLGGQTWTPADQADYDEVGYASWYGAELEGRPTALGEPFRPNAVSAAHRTLPLPSYVEVTRLDTGRTILLRINDRGPADPHRLIDLSAGAAEQLGISSAGVVPVRVRRTNPVEAERRALRSAQAVPERLDTPDSLLEILRERAARLPVPRNVTPPAPLLPPTATTATASPPPAAAASPARPAPAAAVPQGSGPIVVQVGAFSSADRARALATRIGASVVSSGNLHRVRYGPFATQAEAQAAVERARGFGFGNPLVLRDR